MKKLLTGIVLFLLLEIPLSAQDLEERVSIRFTEVPLLSILEELSRQYRLQFSYGDTGEVLEKKWSIEAEDITLRQLLELLLGKAGLAYKKVGEYIVLRKPDSIEEEGEEQALRSGRRKAPAVQQERSLSFQERRLLPDSISLPAGSRKGWMSFSEKPSLVAVAPVRIWLSSALPAKRKEGHLKLSPFMALDFLQLSLRSDYATEQRISADWNYSFGCVGYYSLSRRWAAELALLSRLKRLSVLYQLQVTEVPLGLPERTTLRLSYLELPLGLSREVFSFGQQGRVFCSAGLYGSWLLTKEEKTWLDDGRVFNTTAMYGNTLSPFLWGMRGAFRLGWKLGSRMAFSFSTAYRYCVPKLKEGTQQISIRELSLRTGLVFLL
ncbi:outer membrane beta-barrel protein [Nafulsella turpanensis]|uniref:outer membrane beta-barrel protein n=1 Tax=Nafulsella turpanensis TaxID=1265690 RepID=UPI00034B2576|nr:outer membrane beta-barrel protein [Nafulsella turpanensis]